MISRVRKQSGVKRSRRAVSLEEYLRSRARLAWSAGIALAVIGALAGWADHRGWLAGWADGPGRYEGRSFRVLRVVAGDRLVVVPVSPASDSLEVQLWGINASGPTAGGAREWTAQWCLYQMVTLHIQAHRLRDDNDRLLAFVRLPDGTLLNGRLLSAGLARVDERFSHRAQQRFRMLQQQAKVDRVGRWSPRPRSEQARR